VVAGVRELEEGPAVAVWAGALPGVEIECFHLAAVQTKEGIAVAGFPDLEDPGLVALVVDPFTFPVGPFLARLNETHERIPLVGGLAAGGRQSGRQALILDDAVYAEGAVGAVVSGLPVLTVVSQGCRPIGRESVITRCEGNTSTRSPESRRSSACVGRSPPSPPKSKRSSRADSSPGS